MDGSFDISDITHTSQTIGDLSGNGIVELGVKELILGTSNNTTYAGVISGTGSLVKQGSGIFALTGANTYSGGTTINAGTIALLGKGSLSSSGSIVTSDNASFDISGMTASSQTISDLSGTGGSVILGSKTLIEQTFNSTTYAGVISGEGKLIKKGSGTLTLSRANTYSGGTTINAGSVALVEDGSLASTGSVTTTGKATFNISDITAPSQTIGDLSGAGGSVFLGEKILITETSNDASYSGVISGTGGLIKQGSGVLSLRSENTYTGGTTINAGRIALLGTGSISVTGSLTINDTGCFDISQVTDTVRDVMISDLNGTGGIVVLGEKTLVVISNHHANYAGVINGKGGFGKYGSGTLTLTGASNYTGGTFINAGVLALSGDGSLASTGSIDISGISAGFDISGITASSQTIGDLTGVMGRVLLGEKTLIAGTSNRTTYAGEIAGTGNFVKQGSGVLTLTGINTYTGGTTINNGILELAEIGTLAPTAAVTIHTGSFDISGITASSQTIGDLAGIRGSVFLGGKKLIVGSSNNTSYSGMISGGGQP